MNFIVWAPQDDDYSEERIYYNHEFWEEKMLPNLNKFYLTSLMPEAVSPCRPSGQDICTNFHVVCRGNIFYHNNQSHHCYRR